MQVSPVAKGSLARTDSAKNRNAIDLVTFVNGIPVATLEVKNLLTGQNITHAETQYRKDRSAAGEPLLTFKRTTLPKRRWRTASWCCRQAGT